MRIAKLGAPIALILLFQISLGEAGSACSRILWNNNKLAVVAGRTKQLALLREQDFSNPSSDLPLPGNVKPTDRFQRAAYYAALLPEPKNEREAIAGVLAIARNVSVPFGAPYEGFGIYNTEYRTAINLTDRRYFFELTISPNVIWADLPKFKLSQGAPVMVLNPDNIALSGDVTQKFQKAVKAPF
jgi:penicillin V acylase-like amidase (Ntn superfamily)